MDIFIARQPIFDKKNKVFGYELLYRNSESNKYDGTDGDSATLEVIRNSIVNIGVERLTSNKKAFINFTENILQSDIFSIIPTESVVIEILETVEPTKEIIDKCKKLKKIGFLLALDDFVFEDKYSKLIELADIIKIDFKITTGYERKRIIDKINNKNIKFLAEKVETIQDFEEAVRFGYTYFQGYYFSKPTIVVGKKLPENKVTYMKLIKELNSKDLSIERIEDLVKKDIALSFNLLKLINSANFSFKSEIKSLRQALSLLGENEMKRWLYLFTLKTASHDKPDIIIKNSLIRAKFSELLASSLGKKDICFDAYLTGLLSMTNVLLEAPLNEILKELSVPHEVKEALIGTSENNINVILKLVTSYEAGEWEKVKEYSKRLQLDENILPKIYLQSIDWIERE
jgi:EAL and modified HD-GYP domain-containing signal transduction protein